MLNRPLNFMPLWATYFLENCFHTLAIYNAPSQLQTSFHKHKTTWNLEIYMTLS